MKAPAKVGAKKAPAKGRVKRAPPRGKAKQALTTPTEEELQGSPPREATLQRGEGARQVAAELAERHETGPRLTGGDPDADWQRAHLSGEEAAGGSEVTPDKDTVDEFGNALGVPRHPAEQVRGSADILEDRDARRGHSEE